MKNSILVLLFSLVTFAAAVPATAQSPMEKAISTSFPLTKATADRTDIVTAGAVMTLKKDHFITFAITEPTRANLSYKDGKISPAITTRMTAFSITGRSATNIVQRTFVAGEKLWLIGVQTAADGVTLQFLSDAINDVRYTAYLKFPFPKGSTLSPEEVKSQIGEVISPEAGAPAAAAAAPAPPPAPAEAPIAAIAPPPPPPPGGAGGASPSGGGWRMGPFQSGSEAMIAGTESSNGNNSTAVLGIACSVAPGSKFTKSHTDPNALSLELRLRSGQTTLSNPLYCDPNLNAGSGTVALEGKHSITAPVCNTSKDAAGSLWTFQVYAPIAFFRELAGSPGKSLTVKMGGDKPDEVIADFRLPPDMSQVAPLITACIQSQPPAPAAVKRTH